MSQEINQNNGTIHHENDTLNNDALEIKPDFDVPRYVYFYGMSVILPIGLLCNAICFGVFLSSHSMRKTTTGHYLIALAVADSIFLIGELLRWLNTFDSEGFILGLNFMETNWFWCKVTFYLRYAGKLSSAWITVAIAVERLLTIRFPLKISHLSTPTIAKLIILSIFVLCFAVSSFPFWLIELVPDRQSTYCGYLDENGNAYDIWSLVILRIGSLMLPSAIIFVVTTLIIFFLHQAKKARQTLGGPRNSTSSTRSIDTQLTAMLISVAIAFLVLRLPYTISYYLNQHKKTIWEHLDAWHSYEIYFVNKVCDMIANANYAVNFFMYCVCGSAFRSRLKTCVKSICGQGEVGRTISISLRTMSSKLHHSSRHASPPPVAV